jgi:flagellar biosynthesis/type III secretory pathway protein FliH
LLPYQVLLLLRLLLHFAKDAREEKNMTKEQEEQIVQVVEQVVRRVLTSETKIGLIPTQADALARRIAEAVDDTLQNPNAPIHDWLG